MLALATLLLLTAPTAEAKGKPGRKLKKTEAAAEKADTTKKEKKGYEELLKGAVTDKGMFNVHRKGTDFLFEIPDSLMGRDILIVNKISGVPYALNDAGVNKGMGYGEKIVRFRKDTLYKKVWVMTYDPRITSPEGDRITRSVRDNYRETAIEQFPIDAYGKDADPDVKRLVSCRMVRRLLGDGTGGETPLYPMGATQGSATALGYTQSWTMGSSGSAGELYLSKLEKKLLGAGNRIGAASPVEGLCDAAGD